MNLLLKNYTLQLLSISIFFLHACAGVKNSTTISEIEKSNCSHQPDYQYSITEIPDPYYTLSIDTALSKRYSFRALNMANAIGLLDVLTKYHSSKKEYIIHPNTDKRIELLELAQLVNQRVNTTSLEISSVASELDCEEERASQISNYLKGKEDERENKLIIGSIIVGAAGSIGAELLANSEGTGNAASYVAIGTSVIEVSFGVLMLVNKQKVNFHHHRNTLREIWEGPATAKTLPPTIWYYLNYEDPSKQQPSLRKALAKNWVNFGQVAKKSKKTQSTPSQIYFGDGGKYTAEQLKNRADMYDQIEAYITLMKQDLKQLSIEFEQNR